jgi:hypothetical protein
MELVQTDVWEPKTHQQHFLGAHKIECRAYHFYLVYKFTGQ